MWVSGDQRAIGAGPLDRVFSPPGLDDVDDELKRRISTV